MLRLGCCERGVPSIGCLPVVYWWGVCSGGCESCSACGVVAGVVLLWTIWVASRVATGEVEALGAEPCILCIQCTLCQMHRPARCRASCAIWRSKIGKRLPKIINYRQLPARDLRYIKSFIAAILVITRFYKRSNAISEEQSLDHYGKRLPKRCILES